MCKFLTGPARLQQTEIKRVWKLLDNELYKGEDNKIYLVPRNMLSDNYTIPLFVSFIAGSPVDYDTRASHLHDEWCYFHNAVLVAFTEEQLKSEGYLRYSEKNKMWICEDIPSKFLYTKKVGKCETNNMLYECMKSSGVPLLNRIIVRLGTACNLNWFIYKWLGKIFEPDLEKIYDESWWRYNVAKYR